MVPHRCTSIKCLDKSGKVYSNIHLGEDYRLSFFFLTPWRAKTIGKTVSEMLG